MKIVPFLLLCCMLFSSVVFSQVRFGVLGGLGLASFGGTDATMRTSMRVAGVSYDVKNPDMRTGFTVGAMADIAMNDIVTFHPEVLYTQKGATYSGRGDSVNKHYSLDYNMKYDYVDVPLLMKFSLANESGFKPALFVGPSVGYLVNAKFNTTVFRDSNTVETDSTAQNQKKLDWGLMIGVGVTSPVGGLDLTIGARYCLGLSTINNLPGTADLKNSYASFIIGVAF